MNALGIVSESSTRTSARKPPFIPSFGFHEVHESQPIHASPARIIDAVAALDMRADPVIDALMTVREFPSAVVDTLRKGPARSERARFGFHTFTLLHRDDTSLSLGLVGRFWRRPTCAPSPMQRPSSGTTTHATRSWCSGSKSSGWHRVRTSCVPKPSSTARSHGRGGCLRRTGSRSGWGAGGSVAACWRRSKRRWHKPTHQNGLITTRPTTIPVATTTAPAA